MRSKKRITKKFIVLPILLFILIISSFFLKNIFFGQKYYPHTNKIDQNISLNFRRNITKNAINTDFQFKSIAFEDVQKKDFSFVRGIASVINSLKSLTTLEEKDDFKEKGTWIWTPIMQMTPEYIKEIISGAKENDINVIYVSIDSYLDIFVMEKGREREKLKEEFSQKLNYFISLANENGIAVDAEAGWQNWAEEGNEYKAFVIVNFVKNFNENNKNKFRGFQYDVEPYLLERFKEDPEVVLINFLKLVEKTQKFLASGDLKFSVVIPDFYDEKDKVTPKFSYGGKKAYVFKHLLEILDGRESSSIILMSYRSFASGYDGSIEISRNEMDTAKRGYHSTKIIIAQETGEVEPPYITYHRTSKSYFERQIGRIVEEFDSYPNFSGVAVHYINSYLSLD